MPDRKMQKSAQKGAKKTGKLMEELGGKLDKYRVDETASAKIDEILAKLEELRVYEQDVSNRLKAEREGNRDADADG